MSDAKTCLGRGGRHPLVALVIGIVLVFGLISYATAAEEVSFGVPPWPGERVKAEVAGQILNAIGYKTSRYQASGAFCMNSVGSGKLDVYMAVWRPVNNGVIEPLLKSGHVILLNTNIKDAKYNVVVPDYVWAAGVHSIADLHKYGDKFDHKIYGIEVGNVGNRLMIKAIEHDTYDLGDWELVPSSTAGMLAQAGRAIAADRWIAFLGWKPHWMNVIYHLKYLRDPRGLWGPNDGQNKVQTVASKAFVERSPNVVRFLKQMNVGAKVQSQWIYAYGRKGIAAEKVARDWIGSHPDEVSRWLDGVTTADGKARAGKTLRLDKTFKQ